jgi:hypothetical protein
MIFTVMNNLLSNEQFKLAIVQEYKGISMEITEQKIVIAREYINITRAN